MIFLVVIEIDFICTCCKRWFKKPRGTTSLQIEDQEYCLRCFDNVIDEEAPCFKRIR